MTTSKNTQAEKAEDKVETVEIPAPLVQPLAGGAAPADVDEGREAAKAEVRAAFAEREKADAAKAKKTGASAKA